MKCKLCDGKYEVETCCVSSNFCYDEESGEWVSFQGFVERRKCCKKPLGDGYGDANHFATEKEAEEDSLKWKEKIGKWF